MGSASLAAYELRPRRMLVEELGKLDLKSAVPTTLTGWVEDESSGVVLVNPQTQELLNKLYSEVLTRTYVNDEGHRVMLSIAYGVNQSDDKAVHYPDVCYPAQGFSITRKQPRVIELAGHQLPTYQLMATLGGRREPITYWAMVGDQVVQGPLNHKLVQLRYGFSGRVPDGMIFRVSTIGSNQASEYSVQRDFLAALYEGISPELRSRFFGA